MADPTGIDVSYAQGSFNWRAYRGKISFGMCKVTEGLTITDPDWVHNWNSIWSLNAAHNLPRFAYHFFHASDDPACAAANVASPASGPPSHTAATTACPRPRCPPGPRRSATRSPRWPRTTGS